MVVVMVLIFAMDALAMRVYGRLKEMHEGVRQWLTLAFLTGWIPGVLLLTAGIFAAAGIGSTFLFVLFLAGGMTWLLYLKVLLGMMSFAFYLYFSLEGPRFLRTIQVIFRRRCGCSCCMRRWWRRCRSPGTARGGPGRTRRIFPSFPSCPICGRWGWRTSAGGRSPAGSATPQNEAGPSGPVFSYEGVYKFSGRGPEVPAIFPLTYGEGQV